MLRGIILKVPGGWVVEVWKQSSVDVDYVSIMPYFLSANVTTHFYGAATSYCMGCYKT